jgi:replication factor C subunit 3/5
LFLFQLEHYLQMALWVDKYRPTHLGKMDYHPHLSQQFDRMSSSGDFPHLLVYGPSGSGKKTRVAAFLRNLFGPLNLKIEHRQFSFEKNSRTINVEITTIVSANHIEMNPSEAGFRDVDVIQELVKQMAEGQSLSGKAKVIVIHEVER